MYDQVRTTLEKHQEAWSENQAMVEGVAQFNALLEELKTVSTQHEIIVAGVKTQRDLFIDELIRKAMTLRDGLVALAHDTKKYDVIEKLDFTSAQLKKITKHELSNHMTVIYDLIMEHESEVAVYGVSSEKILAFMNLYEDFGNQIVVVRQGTIERKFLTRRINDLISEIRGLFVKKLDILVRLLSEEQTVFFEAYKDARMLMERKSNRSKQVPPDGESDVGIAS